MLRALRKRKQQKVKLSVSKSMLRSSCTNYWKTSRAIRKHNYNTTSVVDGIHGDTQIANHFREKYSQLFNSVISTDEEMNKLTQRIDIHIQNNCDDPTICMINNCMHCHYVDKSDIAKAVHQLKSNKVNEDGSIYSDNFIQGTDMLYYYLSILFNSMIYHSYAPPSFICASVIPIPKGPKVRLTDSDKYRSIAISSLLGKVLDHVILCRQSDILKSSEYQFGFKPKSSTVLCTTMVTETIQYYTEKGCKPVYLLLLDASKAFDKVSYDVLFNVLLDRKLCPRVIKLLYYMYTNQSCYVNWGHQHSSAFNICNGVRQGGVLSPMLFSIYIDKLFTRLKETGLGCHVGLTYAGVFGYADDVALLAPSIYCLKEMITTCELFAKQHSISFNPNKSKLLCFNIDSSCIAPVFLNGEKIDVVDSDKHLGNYISTCITDRNIIDNVCDFYQRSNWVLSDFGICDSMSLDSLHKTYCMHLYGCELWDLSSKYVDKFRVAWRKIKRRIWGLPYQTHNNIVYNLNDNINLLIDLRILKFTHMSINHSSVLIKSLLTSMLQCRSSIYARNYNYLSFKYELTEADWASDINHLLGRVKMKFQLMSTVPDIVGNILELCNIRDGIVLCHTLGNVEVCKLIDVLCLD